MGNVPKTIKSQIISIDEFEIIKKNNIAFEGYVKDKKGNYLYIMTKTVYLVAPNKSLTNSTLVESHVYLPYPLEPEGVGGGWVYKQNRKQMFFDRTASSQSEVTERYGGCVSYMPEGSQIKTVDPNTGQVTELYKFFVGADHKGYVIDKNGIQLSKSQTVVTGTGITIFATSDDSLDPSTLYKNIFGTTYVGPKNPRDYANLNDSYHFQPESRIEAAAYWHDKGYDKYGAKGAEGAFLDARVAGEDMKLTLRSVEALPANIISPPANSGTEQIVRESGAAVGVILLFGTISIYKSKEYFTRHLPAEKAMELKKQMPEYYKQQYYQQ